MKEFSWNSSNTFPRFHCIFCFLRWIRCSSRGSTKERWWWKEKYSSKWNRYLIGESYRGNFWSGENLLTKEVIGESYRGISDQGEFIHKRSWNCHFSSTNFDDTTRLFLKKMSSCLSPLEHSYNSRLCHFPLGDTQKNEFCNLFFRKLRANSEFFGCFRFRRNDVILTPMNWTLKLCEQKSLKTRQSEAGSWPFLKSLRMIRYIVL